MASYTPLRPETAEDQRRYLEGRLVEVSCLDCLAEVRVRKNSRHHTSIQWTADAQRQCAELARRRPGAGPGVVLESCSRLKGSIEEAVREGRVRVGGPGG